MSDIAIQIENLSKTYQLGTSGHADLRRTLQAQWQKWTNRNAPKEEEFYALKDITFNVQRGEVLGIIGRNGAGKSTLLKILSRITPPTTGRIEINGRIASLLEVGTGFHPELTGRENIFMNGSLLGMTRSEIKQRFDEIVDFSGVERFLDTPVKRYSSGMYVRLAFAVAAHLEPEILLIDEVLAVGDVAFQKKCLGKMNDVAKSGRTVIFVSHNMGAIEELCTRSIWIENGQNRLEGQPKSVIQNYIKSLEKFDNQLKNNLLRKGNGSVKVIDTKLYNNQLKVVEYLKCGGDYQLVFQLQNRTNQDFYSCRFDIGFNYAGSQRVAWISTYLQQFYFSIPAQSTRRLSVQLPDLPLTKGIYSLNLYLENESGLSDWIKDAVFFNVESGAFYESRLLPPENQGFFLLKHHFELR